MKDFFPESLSQKHGRALHKAKIWYLNIKWILSVLITHTHKGNYVR